MDWRCDAQKVVNHVHANIILSSWDSWEHLWNIRNGLASSGWTILWTPKQANAAVDRLAKMAAKSGVGFSFDFCSVEGISSAVLDFVLLQEDYPMM